MEALTDAWRPYENAQLTGVVHVGFWRPETSSFESIAAQWDGRVLLTAAARYALPASYAVAPAPIGEVEGIPLYVGLAGWGYEISAEQVGQCGLLTPDVGPAVQHGFRSGNSVNGDWLVAEAGSQLAAEARIAGVIDEASYIQQESRLPTALRTRLGLARYVHFVGSVPAADSVIDNLQYAPPWLLKLPISALDLSVRASNCMRENCVQVVEDLSLFGVEALLKFEKFGRKSLRDVEEKLVSAFERGPATPIRLSSDQPLASSSHTAESVVHTEPTLHALHSEEVTNLKEALAAVLALLNERDAVTMRLRMGFDGKPKTLQEIGEALGLTRERIRQREQHCVKIMARHSIWRYDMQVRLERLLSRREDPLPLLGLEILDLWFAGAEQLEAPLDFALEHFCGQRFSLVRTRGMVFVSALSQLAWDKAVRSALRILEAEVSQQPTESDARSMIDSLLVGAGEELRSELWTEATRWAHFAAFEGDGTRRRLVSFGAGAESLVEAVLAGSDRPMHYTEIARLCAQHGRDVEVRRAHHSAANVGLLFGRGVYGLAKHIPLSATEQNMLIAEVEDLIEGADPTRQWHAREIAEAMEERGMDFGGRLTPYVVSIALEGSQRLVNLGRMVWTSRSTGARGSNNRIDVHQAVVSLLMAEGRPMRSSEIKERIERERGLNCFFQIHVEGPLVRLGAGLWGLIDRDLPFTEQETGAIVDLLVLVLQERGKGLHVSEIREALEPIVPEVAAIDDPMVFVGLAQRDERCATGKGGYVFLREWGDPRRLTVLESVRRALVEVGAAGITLDAVVAAAEALAERPMPRLLVGQTCGHLGAVYDETSMRWTLPAVSELGEMSESDREAA
ncbi:DNA-directed RNA polymerase subunit alpha C-terminal domain-containing protein [Paraburkholderia sp.]|uniref:DNA-directed RNA polymerase subunit alpha C-terminal domain-containing protein n=1 Tax=Paraburkholderia sp. TaxID=1926495 RepID=UPI00397D0859